MITAGTTPPHRNCNPGEPITVALASPCTGRLPLPLLDMWLEREPCGPMRTDNRLLACWRSRAIINLLNLVALYHPTPPGPVSVPSSLHLAPLGTLTYSAELLHYWEPLHVPDIHIHEIQRLSTHSMSNWVYPRCNL